MTGYLIYPSSTPRGNNAFSWFCDTAARYGIGLQVLFYDSCGVSEEIARLPLPDFVLLRGYNTTLSEWYEARGVKVINPTDAMRLSRDKAATARALTQAWIPTPKTYSEGEIFGTTDYSTNAADRCRTDMVSTDDDSGCMERYSKEYDTVCHTLASSRFILKQNFGSKGENVFLVSSAQEYAHAVALCRQEQAHRLEMFDIGSITSKVRGANNDSGDICSKHGEPNEISCSNAVSATGRQTLLPEFGETREEVLHGCSILFQEYIEASFGRDIRVWVCSGEVIGHILRYNDHSFKSNFAAGGSFRRIPLPPKAAQLAIDATRCIGLYFAGIDLLYTSDGGFTVCEVNGNPGFRTAPTDIPDGIFRTLFNLTSSL